jgi:putative endonuclease
VGKSDCPARKRGRVGNATTRSAASLFALGSRRGAAALLIGKGYRIRARRFRTPLGKIDIVARRCGMLVFVDVKAR